MGKVLICLPDNLERAFRDLFVKKKGDLSRITSEALYIHLGKMYEKLSPEEKVAANVN